MLSWPWLSSLLTLLIVKVFRNQNASPSSAAITNPPPVLVWLSWTYMASSLQLERQADENRADALVVSSGRVAGRLTRGSAKGVEGRLESC